MRIADSLQRLGIAVSALKFIDDCVREFNRVHGTLIVGKQLTVDELLLHPWQALTFCRACCSNHGWLDFGTHPQPVDGDTLNKISTLILRVLMNRRKNPKDDGRPLLWHTKARKTKPQAKASRKPSRRTTPG